MSDAPTPDRPEDAPAEDVFGSTPPQMEEPDRDVTLASVRHAPRLGRMLGTGVGIGVLAGLILGFALPNSTGVGRGMVAIVAALGLGLMGALIGGTIATRADKVSNAKADAQRAQLVNEMERRREQNRPLGPSERGPGP